MPEEVTKVELRKLKDNEVNSLKGKLVEVRRVGVAPIFISVTTKDSVKSALEKADVPTGDGDGDIKVEGQKANSQKWDVLKLTSRVYTYSKLIITTKVSGA